MPIGLILVVERIMSYPANVNVFPLVPIGLILAVERIMSYPANVNVFPSLIKSM